MGNTNDPQIDPAMLELFQAEIDTHVPVLNEGLLALEKGNVDARAIDGMMRAAHSIKGAARIVGISMAVRLAHVMEDCFTAAKESRITLASNSVDVLLQGVDMLQRICSHSDAPAVSEAELDELVAQLTAIKDGVPSKAARPTSIPIQVRSSASDDPPVQAVLDPEIGTVCLPATFNESTSEALRQELMARLAAGARNLRIDFAQVANLSASGLALLSAFSEEAQASNPPLGIDLLRVNPVVRSVLRVAGLETAFGSAVGVG